MIVFFFIHSNQLYLLHIQVDAKLIGGPCERIDCSTWSKMFNKYQCWLETLSKSAAVFFFVFDLLLCYVCSVPGRSVGSSSGTDVLQGRSGQKHVSCWDAVSVKQQHLRGWGAEVTCFFLFGLFSYGTGCFLLRNTGNKVPHLYWLSLKNFQIQLLEKQQQHRLPWFFSRTTPDSLQHLIVLLFQPVMSDHGLLTTVAYKLGRDKPACYALEVPSPSYFFPTRDLLERAE